MNCTEAKEQILALFDCTPAQRPGEQLARHLGECMECAVFLTQQQELELELSAALSPPELPAEFRAQLKKRIPRAQRFKVFSSIPELALLGSCLAATVVCAALLPSPRIVAAIGIAFTAVTYLIETTVLSALEDLDEARI